MHKEECNIKKAILSLINSSSIALTPTSLSKNHTIHNLIYKYKKSNNLPASRFDNYSHEINGYCNQLLKQNLIRDISNRVSNNSMGLFIKLNDRTNKKTVQTIF